MVINRQFNRVIWEKKQVFSVRGCGNRGSWFETFEPRVAQRRDLEWVEL
jgi:hypothetical protein